MSFALAQSSSGVICQQKPASKLRNVVVAAQRPAAVEKKQPNALARIGGASLGAAAAALLMVGLSTETLLATSILVLVRRKQPRIFVTENLTRAGIPSICCQGQGADQP